MQRHLVVVAGTFAAITVIVGILSVIGRAYHWPLGVGVNIAGGVSGFLMSEVWRRHMKRHRKR